MSQPSEKSRFIVAMTGAIIVMATTWMVRHPRDATRGAVHQSAARASTGAAKTTSPATAPTMTTQTPSKMAPGRTPPDQ